MGIRRVASPQSSAEEGRINQTPTDREGEEERRGEEGGGPRPEIVEGIING
jgi:hypothetical protein